MNISCISCPARYGVPDAKLVGKRVRITCKRCGAILLVDGTVNPPRVSSGANAGPSVAPVGRASLASLASLPSRAETGRRISGSHAGRPAGERRRRANRAPLPRSADQRRVARLARGNGRVEGSLGGRGNRCRIPAHGLRIAFAAGGPSVAACPGKLRRAATTHRRMSSRAVIRLLPRNSTMTRRRASWTRRASR